MSNLIMHCGGEHVTRNDVCAVRTPENTATYVGVDYAWLLDLVEDVADGVLGLDLYKDEYGLNRKGNQLFAAFTYKDKGESGLSIGVRASHDKSLPVGIVAGSRVFVCDNLAFCGESFRVVRRHTKNVLNDVKSRVAEGISEAAVAHDIINDAWAQMKPLEMDLDEGYAMIGQALGHNVLKAQQATRAFRSWSNEFALPEAAVEALPQHGPTMYGLYQAFTEGCKQGAAATRIPALVDVDSWMRGKLTLRKLGTKERFVETDLVPALEID
jgi:hypothetical protein